MITGSCLCGAVHYEVEAAGPTYNCHCGRCRKWSGGAFATAMRAPLASLKITAGESELTRYASSPGINRCFCRRCGSSLFTERHDRGLVHVRLGTTDGDPGVRPEYHVWTGSKAPWWDIADDLERIEGTSLPQPPTG